MGNTKVTATIKGIHQGKIRPDPDFLKIDDIRDSGVTANTGHVVYNTLYTIGYGNRKPVALLKILKDNGIETVVDVRRAFSKSWCRKYWQVSIKEWLESEGYKHIYGDELGNQYDSLEEYKKYQFEIRKAELEWLAHDIQANYGKTCLLCAEIDPSKCHRSILADKLLEILGADWKVVHL